MTRYFIFASLSNTVVRRVLTSRARRATFSEPLSLSTRKCKQWLRGTISYSQTLALHFHSTWLFTDRNHNDRAGCIMSIRHSYDSEVLGSNHGKEPVIMIEVLRVLLQSPVKMTEKYSMTISVHISTHS